MIRQSIYPSFWRKLLTSLKQKRSFRYGIRWFYLLIFLAILGNYFANDIPLYCKYKGTSQFPIFQKSFAWAGINSPFNEMTDWSSPEFTSKILPIIPYHATTIDMPNSLYKSPFGKQNIKSLRYRHWLGTDRIGRDVLAGIISGARVSIFVSFLGMGIASLIGLLLGTVSGFYGDRKLVISFWKLVLLLGVGVVFLWLAYALPVYFSTGGAGQYRSYTVFGLVALYLVLLWAIKKIQIRKRQITIPVDGITMRSIEIFSAVPKLLLILVLSALLPSSIYVIALIIGITHWPTITRLTRSEMIKIREKEYMIAAQTQQISKQKMLFQYALPNAIGPAMIIILLGLGDAILVEAFLSFLGLGLPADVVSWGKFLAASRLHFSAWWLAIFPGFCIFLTIYAANKIGELLTLEMKQH